MKSVKQPNKARVSKAPVNTPAIIRTRSNAEIALISVKLYHDKYTHACEQYALAMFKAYVRPWLRLTGYELITGMGSWAILDPSRKGQYNSAKLLDRKQLPRIVRNVLEKEIPGSNDELGLWLPDYNPDVDRANNGRPNDKHR